MKRHALQFAAFVLAIVALGAAPGVVSVTVPPDSFQLKPGVGSSLAAANCETCHSVAYITTQPRLSLVQWTAEVTKMKNGYGAPIATANIAPIAAYLASTYGSGAPLVSKAPAAAAPPSSGAQLYAANCSACHGATGAGSAGVFPPLAGDAVVTARDPKTQITIVLHGLAGKVIGGKTYASPMPPFAQLTDADIAAIINHERTSWGNNAPLTTPADVKRER